MHSLALPFGRTVAVPWADVAEYFPDWKVKAGPYHCGRKSNIVTLEQVLQKVARVHREESKGSNCRTVAGTMWMFLARSGCHVRLLHKCLGPDTNE